MFNTLVKYTATACLALTLGMSASNADELKIGLMAPSPAGDVGWTKTLKEGLDAVHEKYGDKVKVSLIENISEGPDADRVVNQMVSEGNDVLVLGSFGYMNSGVKAAKRNPDVTVLHASGYKTSKNMSAFVAKYFEGSYLMGMAAADLSKSKKLGVVAAFAIPELISTINGFTLGARSVDPEIEVSVIWINSWFDPAKAQSSAKALISQGVDVIFSNSQDTPSVVSVAEKEGVYVFNLNSSMKEYAPTKYIGVVQTDWAPYFLKSVDAHMNGTFDGQFDWLGMAENTVVATDWSPDISKEAMEKIKATEAAIKSGEFEVFSGPIVNQDGSEVLAKGSSLSKDDILGMNWHVQGVTSPLPN